ncbi:hypothetical protein [Kribbella sindirgiensis]|uniref:Uncharacterized protein n=1 Tax=Kribbella sindirgiensis TaxID=1124744 RepID=A0A4R0I2E1_9ACTN|nr:hypothetical protein [Kribbella sindirgiensis]TCC20574.1 hypothetical protein E0H50_36710 [Kribbella sindirgiensis]
MAVFTVVGALWIAAEAFADPGGWPAAGLTATWLVPLIGLSIVAWQRIAWTTVMLGALTAAAIGLSGIPGLGSLSVVSGPALATGALYLAADAVQARGRRRTTSRSPAPSPPCP